MSFSFPYNDFAQSKIGAIQLDGDTAVSSYLSLLRQEGERFGNAPSSARVRGVLSAISIGKLKHIAHLIYDASEYNALALQDSIMSRAKENGKRGVVSPPKEPSPFFVQAKVLNDIRRRISPSVYALARVPYILRIKVTKVETQPHELGIPGAHLYVPMTIITGSVLNVYKGRDFKQDQQIQFYFLDQWAIRAYSFAAGSEYVVPIDPRNSLNPKNKLAWFARLDHSDAYFAIRNDTLLDPHNLLGFGRAIQINAFETKLGQLQREIQSW